MPITKEQLREDPAIRTYIIQADATLHAMGYTEHSFAHVTQTAQTVERLLRRLDYGERMAELGWMAGYLHDIGNVINRVDHAHTGAVMAFQLLTNMGMDPAEIAAIVTAIGHHDEGTALPVSPIAAALILADKSDVRRSRVRNRDQASFDIHDRVNYAVEHAHLVLDTERGTLSLELTIDTAICSVMDYFEIFLTRMLLCRKAADFLGLTFKLLTNGSVLL